MPEVGSGLRLPALALPSTSGDEVLLAGLERRTVLYLYPKTGRPGVAMPDGWDLIPGASGCTAEACAFRDRHEDLRAAGTDIYGLSSQSTADQLEAVLRLELPFPLLSDTRLETADALLLPTFTVVGERLFERLTLVVAAGFVEHVFYPVSDPETHPVEVLAWIRGRRA